MVGKADIKNEIIKLNKSRISLDDLYMLVSKVSSIKIEELKTVHYREFYDTIDGLVKDDFIYKCGAKTNKKSFELYLKYNVNIKKEKLELDKEELKFLAVLNKKINTNYYRKNIKAFREDKEYIRIYNDFLNEIDKGMHQEFISINERSFELFNDEKIIKGGTGVEPLAGISLRRLKLNYEDIHCRDNYQPLLMLTLPTFFSKDSRNILIVENLDTYWTLNKMAMENIKFRNTIDMLIYGEGNAITGEFSQYERYTISAKDKIKYFGDLDNHGIYIYSQFKEKYKELNVGLATRFYNLMMDFSDIERLKKTRKENQSKVSECLLSGISKEFDIKYGNTFKDILECDRYIPQEVLNYNNLNRYLEENEVNLLE